MSPRWRHAGWSAIRLAVAGIGACLLLLALAGPASAAAPAAPDDDGGGGVLGPFTTTDPDGVGLDHYDITGDPGGWADWGSKVLLFAADGLFALTRAVVGAEVWLLNWAFEFGPAEAIVEPARQLADTYQQHVIAALGLPAFLLTMAGLWCGIQILRGRTSQGAGELLISLLISAAAVSVLARPAELLLGEDGLLGHTRDTAMALASITATQGRSDSADPRQAARPLSDTLITTFVIQPHQTINYGTQLDRPGRPHRCFGVYKTIVKDGPWGDDEQPRERMERAGCKQLADYNRDPTWDRLLGTLLLLLATLVLGVLILIMVGVLLTAIFACGAYAIVGNAVLVIAVLPGGARGLLWRWVGGLAKIVLVICAVVVFIPLFALFIRALLDASDDLPLVGRFILLDLAAVAGLVYHRKLIGFGTRAGHRIGRRLEMARYGGARGGGWNNLGGGGGGYGYGPRNAGWLGGGNPGDLSPVSLRGTAREARREAGRAAEPFKMAGQVWTGSRAKGAKAVGKLPPDAGRLRQRLARTRGGRVTLGAAKAATIAGKVAIGGTIGAPVTVPKAAAAARSRARQLKQRLQAARTRHTASAQQTASTWSRNTGLSATATRVAAALATDRDRQQTRGLLDGARPKAGTRSQAGDLKPASPVEAVTRAQARSAADRLRRRLNAREQARQKRRDLHTKAKPPLVTKKGTPPQTNDAAEFKRRREDGPKGGS